MKARRTWVLAVVLGAVVLIAVGLELQQRGGGVLNWAIRTLALLGYPLIFLAILSSAYLRQLVRYFGRPFIQVHHVLSVAGLALIALHPLAVAYESLDLGVFLPRFDSLYTFLLLGGRPALLLLALALLAALLRRPLGARWRWLHALNYIAFLLGTAHANLIGTNFQSPAPRIVSLAMALAVIAVFVRRRLPQRRPAAPPRRPGAPDEG